jgi:crotonobetainyl-CoA:carnitine CoA-transferase CaiB-like acyl-CoA transferase
MEHTTALAAELERTYGGRPSAYWLTALTDAGIPCGPIYTVAEMLDDPQTRARGMAVEVEHPVAGRITNIGNPVKLSETPWSYRASAPELGQDTDAVLAALGYDAGAIERMRADGAI